MDRTQRKRYLLRTWLEILACGFVYLMVITLTDLRIPCVFRMVTGYDCPGCGVTRMAYALVHLDFRTAFASNPFVLCLLPFAIPYAVYRSKKFINGKEDHFSPLETGLLCLVLAAAVVFGIVRNLPL